MDAHFSEYLAAVVGMAELYGTATDEALVEQPQPSETSPLAAVA